MQTALEAQQDSIAQERFERRERVLLQQRENLRHHIRNAEQQAQRLRKRLAKLDPEAPAAAELTGAIEDLEEDLDWLRHGARYQLVADALAVLYEDGSGEYVYTPAEVKEWCERAVEFDAAHPRIDAEQISDLLRLRSLPNAPFRARVLELLAEGASMDQLTLGVWFHLVKLEERDGCDYGAKNLVSERTGRQEGQVRAQARHLERMLGMATNGPTLRLFIPYELGVALMRALGMSPQQAGL